MTPLRYPFTLITLALMLAICGPSGYADVLRMAVQAPSNDHAAAIASRQVLIKLECARVTNAQLKQFGVFIGPIPGPFSGFGPTNYPAPDQGQIGLGYSHDLGIWDLAKYLGTLPETVGPVHKIALTVMNPATITVQYPSPVQSDRQLPPRNRNTQSAQPRLFLSTSISVTMTARINTDNSITLRSMFSVPENSTLETSKSPNDKSLLLQSVRTVANGMPMAFAIGKLFATGTAAATSHFVVFVIPLAMPVSNACGR